MRNIGLIAVGVIRILTQLLWPYFGEYWYYVGQSMFETYVILYAAICVYEKHKVFFNPICYLFYISLLNFVTDLTAFRFDQLHHILIALLLTFGTSLWIFKY